MTKKKAKAVLARRLKAYKAVEDEKGYKKPGSQNSHKSHTAGRKK